jgi:signal transduction histidine kinase
VVLGARLPPPPGPARRQSRQELADRRILRITALLDGTPLAARGRVTGDTRMSTATSRQDLIRLLASVDLFEKYREDVLAGLVAASRTLGPRECVGELALIDAGPRSTSARAVEPTTLLEISQREFERYLRSDLDALTALMRTLSGRLRNMIDETQAAYESVNMLVHDMLNLVTILLGAAIVRDTLPEGDERRDMLESVEHAQQTLETMMRSALRRSRNISAPYHKEPVDIDALVQHCLKHDLGRHPDVKRVKTSFQVEPPLMPVECNSTDIRRVIANLVINAAQALPDGGTIEITVAQEKGETRIAVHDDGAGIPEALLARIFEPHFTTKPEGHGLGLSACKEIVERLHGGSLTCISSPGRGATFVCGLPG